MSSLPFLGNLILSSVAPSMPNLEESVLFRIGRIRKPKPMPFLVDAVVLQIYLNSEFDEVIALSKVDRRHYQISNIGVIWHRLAYLMQCRGQCFVLDYFKDPQKLTTQEIRRAVLRSHDLRRNWLTSNPTYRHVCYELVTNHAPDDIILHTEKYVVFTESNNIMVVNLESKMCIGEIPQTDMVRIRSFWNVDSGVYILSRFISAVHRCVFRIVNLTLPEQNGTDLAEFKIIKDIYLPLTGRGTLRHITMDPARRRLAACYLEDPDTDSKLFVILDWAAQTAVRLSTGVTHVPEKTSVGIDFPIEGDRLAFISESTGVWSQRTYYVKDMEEHATDLNSALTCKAVRSYAHQASMSYHELLSASQRSYGGHILSQWWPLYKDVPPVLTCIFMLKDAATETWLMGQHYADETMPRTNRRTVVPMKDPVIETSGEPMVALQFNHFCWVDQEVIPRETDLISLGLLKKRVLRLATFAEPERDLREGAIDGLTAEGITLDIPEEVLRYATYISVNVSIAAVVIVTKMKELHIFRFA